MGRSPQRAAGLHFSATGISRKNANGPGPRKHWRARTRARRISVACRSAPRSGGLQSAVFTREFARNIAGSPRSGGPQPAVFARNFTRRKQPRRTECADSRRAMAHPNSRPAADVFCRVASCPSLRAAQHQSRFKHAVVPFPLRKTTHRRRAFCGGVATFGFRCATGRLGGCSHVRCKMCCGLFDGA